MTTPDPDTEINLDALHDAIVASIADAFPIFETVEAYREDRKSLPVPACLVTLLDLEPNTEDDPGTEQLAVTASFEAQLVLGFRKENVERAVRKLAAAVGAHVHQQRWGHPVEPARVITIAPDEFSPELDRYSVWRVEWQQVLHVGESAFWVGDVPSVVLGSWAPDIGPENEDAYEPIVGECEDPADE